MTACMCEWQTCCYGTGMVACSGCGGDQCVCVCGGDAVECEGCDMCPSDDEPDMTEREEREAAATHFSRSPR